MRALRKCLVLAAVVAILCVGLFLFNHSENNAAADYGFLAQISGYWAGGVDERGPMSFTLFYKDKLCFQPADVSSIKLKDIHNAVSIENLESAEPEEREAEGYKHAIYYFDLHVKTPGLFQTDAVIFYLNDGSEIEYKIGKWTFDIGQQEDEQGLVDAWQSSAATSNHTEFMYHYRLKEGVKIRSIQIGESTILSGEAVEPEGRIPFDSDTYITYIRSKIVVEQDGAEYAYYGKGYYAGVMNIPKEEIDKMSQFTGEKIFQPE